MTTHRHYRHPNQLFSLQIHDLFPSRCIDVPLSWCLCIGAMGEKKSKTKLIKRNLKVNSRLWTSSIIKIEWISFVDRVNDSNLNWNRAYMINWRKWQHKQKGVIVGIGVAVVVVSTFRQPRVRRWQLKWAGNTERCPQAVISCKQFVWGRTQHAPTRRNEGDWERKSDGVSLKNGYACTCARNQLFLFTPFSLHRATPALKYASLVAWPLSTP